MDNIINFMEHFNWGAISSLATVIAIIVNIPTRKLRIFRQTHDKKNVDYVEFVVTCENVGNRPIVIRNLGFKLSKNTTDTTLDKYRETDIPLIINPKETKIILYSIPKKSSLRNNYSKILVNRKKKFVIEDTTGKKYFG